MNTPRTRSRCPRHGTVYAVVLGLCVLVAAMAIGAVATVRSRNRAAGLEDAIGDARAYAWSAAELGRLEMVTNPAWRTQHRNDSKGEWFSGRPFDRGTMTLKVVNPAGSLDRAESDAVVLTATGVRGGARQMVQVTLVPNLTPMTCLDSAAFAAAGVAAGTAWITGSGTLSTNGDITATSAAVELNAEAAGNVSGATYSGTSRSRVPQRSFPDATVFDYYKANGTAIPYASFPAISTGRGISGNLLTPNNNPFGGGTNASGIYVVDCGGQDFTVDTSRIVGTLVLLNAGPNSGVTQAVNWVAAVDNFPCLLVQGSFSLKASASTLRESKVNLNPANNPYPWGSGGTTDTDTTDSYPATVDGLVYVSGNVTTSGLITVRQIVCGGTLGPTNALTLNYNGVYQSNPPPGFRVINMNVLPGSWRPFSN